MFISQELPAVYQTNSMVSIVVTAILGFEPNFVTNMIEVNSALGY